MADPLATASSSRGGGETTRRVLFGNLEMVRIDFAGFLELGHRMLSLNGAL
jgi:hypothetical protein